MTRVSAGPYTLDIPPNGVAVLYEADGAGIDHQLPGGVGYLDALVQFAGEVIRLRALPERYPDTMYQEIAELAEEVAFWKFQAFWHRAQLHTPKLNHDNLKDWKQLEAEFEHIRIEENRERWNPEAPRDPGAT